jgi:hypothetical protein
MGTLHRLAEERFSVPKGNLNGFAASRLQAWGPKEAAREERLDYVVRCAKPLVRPAGEIGTDTR